jgi:hypothetical protein
MKKLLLFISVILLSGSLMAQGPQHKAKGDSCKMQKECKHKDTKCCNSKIKQVAKPVAKPTECKSSTAGKTTVDTKPTK